jgi:malonyl-CoA/methylmalonyl-CoA synthetase
VPIDNANVFAAIRAAFPNDRHSIAIEVTDPTTGDTLRTITWEWIDHTTAQLANLLASLNLSVGARVAVQTDKSVEALMLYLAVLRAGYVYLPLNVAYQAGEIDYFVGNAQPEVVVYSDRNKAWTKPIVEQNHVPHVFTLDDDGSGTLMQRASEQSSTHTIAIVSSKTLAAILYTSGTTGRSKGAMLSHRNLLSNAQCLVKEWGFTRADTLIHALPIFHVHGLFVASHCALLSGTKMIWFNKFDGASVVKRIPEATVFMGVPTMYVRLLAESQLNQDRCKRIRLFVSGSAPLLVETFNTFQERTEHTILERYGMTETNMLCSNPYRTADGQRRGGTVGKPLPGVLVRTRSDGKPCATDEIGGIEVTGPNVFSGYWQMPEKTREDFTPDGWFKTGDVGKIDSDGYVTIVGRSKDLIISGGFNVYPAEIEAFINDMPAIAESAVIGVPHPDFGEAVVAVVVPKPNAIVDGNQIVSELKNAIAHFKVPKRVFVVNDLPRNAMGKVQKNVLRQTHKGLFVSAND